MSTPLKSGSSSSAVSGESRDNQQLATLGRIGVWRSGAVDTVTTVLLLRLRHQITTTRSSRSSVLLVEEALPVAWQGRSHISEVQGDQLLAWLQAPAIGNLPEAVRQDMKTVVLWSQGQILLRSDAALMIQNGA